jgi:hypothetical protein
VPPSDDPQERFSHDQMKRVQTDLDMAGTWSILGSDLASGPQPRDFTMVRNRDSEPWRVAEAGQY